MNVGASNLIAAMGIDEILRPTFMIVYWVFWNNSDNNNDDDKINSIISV